MLNPEKMHGYEPTARLEAARLSARRLLNSKLLIKHYDSTDDTALSDTSVEMTWKCYVKIDGHSGDSVCPPKIFTLPVTATLGVLKAEVTKAFKET